MLRYILLVLIVFTAIGAKSQITKTGVADSSTFTIKETGKSERFAIISINVKDKDSRMNMLGTVGFRDHDDKPVLTFFTDKNGFGYVNLFDVSNIAWLTIDNVGYHTIRIPITKLRKGIWKIDAFLQGESLTN